MIRIAVAALLFATSFVAVPLETQARGPSTYNNGPIILDKVECVQKKVKICWLQDGKKVCEWMLLGCDLV